MNVLLTSAGLESEVIRRHFMASIPATMEKLRVLFIPTAAQSADAIAVLPKCMDDLLQCGIPALNITVFDLHRGMSLTELEQFHAVYLCGGTTAYLLRRMNDTGFSQTLMQYIRNGGAVLGVSAGSVIFASNHPQNLGLVPFRLSVHCSSGHPAGILSAMPEHLYLTNASALVIRDLNDMEVIGGST